MMYSKMYFDIQQPILGLTLKIIISAVEVIDGEKMQKVCIVYNFVEKIAVE